MEEQSVIHKELKRYEKKIKEFQDYLEMNPILPHKDDVITESYKTAQYKEIDIQSKVMNNLPTWLEALKKLRATEEKKVEIRGSAEVSGMFKK